MKTVLTITMSLFLAAPAFAAQRPNILLITADDLGCQLSCYGEKRFSTPRLDALVAQGARFENFYVAQSSCSSSRAALLTGRWPHQNGQMLFDLRTDPDETKNVADNAACADVRQRLEAALQTWREKTGDATLDAARVRRWQDAAARWGALPKVPAGPSMVVHIPVGELELLK